MLEQPAATSRSGRRAAAGMSPYAKSDAMTDDFLTVDEVATRPQAESPDDPERHFQAAHGPNPLSPPLGDTLDAEGFPPCAESAHCATAAMESQRRLLVRPRQQTFRRQEGRQRGWPSVSLWAKSGSSAPAVGQPWPAAVFGCRFSIIPTLCLLCRLARTP